MLRRGWMFYTDELVPDSTVRHTIAIAMNCDPSPIIERPSDSTTQHFCLSCLEIDIHTDSDLHGANLQPQADMPLIFPMSWIFQKCFGGLGELRSAFDSRPGEEKNSATPGRLRLCWRLSPQKRAPPLLHRRQAPKASPPPLAHCDLQLYLPSRRWRRCSSGWRMRRPSSGFCRRTAAGFHASRFG